ncbi:MAG TPA: MlaD family protein [Solirubrobacteraceae bacterium]|jgi:virulence factor Mce-like protein
MQKRAPTLANILVIVLFALSCFGLLLFLWESFGGPVPLKPKGYRFTVVLSRSLSLAEQSDVRISGVSVGHVISLTTEPNGKNDVTVEMNHRYAPVRSNDRMILRQKTLLGETYIELLPQARSSRALPDGGTLSADQVERAVTLDDILASLEPRERSAFKAWQQEVAASYNGRGEQINSGFAEVEPFVTQGNKLLTVLASQEGAVRSVVRNLGVVFDALTERDNQFRGFVESGAQSFHALAQSSQQFADAIRALPTFERRGTTTLRELDKLANEGSPVLDEAHGWERALTPLLRTAKSFAPNLDSLLTGLGPLASASKKGLPTVRPTLHNVVPLLENVTPVLRNLDPLLQFAGDYIPEVQAFFANLTAVTQAHDKNGDFGEGGPIQHYVRALVTVGPEALAVYNQRIGVNRANPYFQAGGLSQIAGNALPSFSTANCADSAPSIVEEEGGAVSSTTIKQLIEDHVVNGQLEEQKNAKGEVEHKVVKNPTSTANEVSAPPCLQQSPFTWEATSGQYPHVTAPPPLK